MEVLGKEISLKIIFGLAATALLLLLVGFWVLPGKGASHERELFSLIPSEGLSGVGYLEINKEGLDEIFRLVPFIQKYSNYMDGLALAVGTYEDGSTAMAAFIKTERKPIEARELYGDFFGGAESEILKIKGSELTAVYSKSDLEKRNPICIWERSDGIGVLAVWRIDSNGNYCSFQGDVGCRGQRFEKGLMSIKIRGLGERIVITGAACGAASLSSKNLRYVAMQDIILEKNEETWIRDIPCYDAGNNLAKGASFYGKVFLKYYFEREGSGSPKLISGDVGAASETSVKQGVGGLRCIDLLEKSYRPEEALNMFSKINALKETVQQTGTLLASGKFSGEQGGLYIASYEKEDTDYVIIIGNSSAISPISGSDSFRKQACIGGAGSNTEIIRKDGKIACKRIFELGVTRGISYERMSDLGTGLVVLGFAKGTGSVDSVLSEIVFGFKLDGSDISWKNETNGKVLVYLVNTSTLAREPLGGAYAELYPIGTSGQGTPLETKITSTEGTVIFEHVPLNGAIVRVGKPGYESTTGKVAEGILDEQDDFSTSLDLIPISSGNALGDYLVESKITSLDAGIPDARGTFPSLSAYGIELVDLKGHLRSLVLVGNNSPAEEVAAASRIAEILAAREYECKKAVETGYYRVEPFGGIGSVKILFTDETAPAGVVIAVGNPETNSILRGAIGSLEGANESTFVLEKDNVIAVVGSGKEAMTAARAFVSNLKTKSPNCGGDSYYGNTRIIDSTGRPIAKVVIGRLASVDEALAGAYIAAKIASLSAKCVKIETETVGCVPATGNPEQLVVTDESDLSGYNIISIGGPMINGFTDKNCDECREVKEGNAIIRAIGSNIYLAGYRKDDTLTAISEFASLITSPTPSYQSRPYYGIKVSGFNAKETGHNEVILSFYESQFEITNTRATATPGDYYMLQGRKTTKISSVYSRNPDSAYVVFEIDGKNVTVPMGKFLCPTGAVESEFRYCVKERVNTSVWVDSSPKPALLMNRLRVFVDYFTQSGENIGGANCSYCILGVGTGTICRNLTHGAPYYDNYRDDFVLSGLTTGPYTIEANCSAEGYKNATGRANISIARMELPDLIVDGIWIKSVVNTKITVSVRVKNIGTKEFKATDSNPLVTCLWDGNWRNVFSHASYNASMKPGETFEFTQPLILPSIEVSNIMTAKVDCNNLHAEQDEGNNEKSIKYGRYG